MSDNSNGRPRRTDHHHTNTTKETASTPSTLIIGQGPDNIGEPVGTLAWLHLIRDDPAVIKTRHCVLAAVAGRVNAKGTGILTVAELVTDSGYSPNVVRREIRWATRRGYLTLDRVQLWRLHPAVQIRYLVRGDNPGLLLRVTLRRPVEAGRS